MKLQRIVDGIYRLETTVSGTAMPLALYLVEGDGWLLTDAGCRGMIDELVVPALAELSPGARIGKAVVCHAHADHFGGGYELLQQFPDCRIYVHRRDARWVQDPAWHLREGYDRLAPDYSCPDEVKSWVAGLLGPGVPVRRLETGDVVSPGAGRHLAVLSTPGHSPGHIALWEDDRRVLLASDALLGVGQRIDGQVVAIPSYLDVDDYLNTVRAIRYLEPSWLLTAHYPVMRDEQVMAFCDESEQFVELLGSAVWEQLRQHPACGVQELTDRVVPEVAPGVESSVVAGFSVEAHLEWLEQRGLASWEIVQGRRCWSAL
ncbi:MAG: MBL fold metallo-hydrolase [Trueperaceae bacterium]|nr:MAG: MBL fold metallo-hydrolase [Trueperaceae bacterium]